MPVQHLIIITLFISLDERRKIYFGENLRKSGCFNVLDCRTFDIISYIGRRASILLIFYDMIRLIK